MLTWSSSGLETGEPISGDFSDCCSVAIIFLARQSLSSAWASSHVVVFVVDDPLPDQTMAEVAHTWLEELEDLA